MSNEIERKVESMADAMLGGFVEKKEEPEKAKAVGTTSVTAGSRSVTYSRGRSSGGWDDLEDKDEWESGGRRAARKEERPSKTLHTTSKGARAAQPSYAPGSARSQAIAQVGGSSLRQTLAKLGPTAVDNVDSEALLAAMHNALLDALEKQDWMLLGSAEAFMFKEALRTNMQGALRAFLMKIVINDVMRDRTKPKL